MHTARMVLMAAALAATLSVTAFSQVVVVPYPAPCQYVQLVGDCADTSEHGILVHVFMPGVFHAYNVTVTYTDSGTTVTQSATVERVPPPGTPAYIQFRTVTFKTGAVSISGSPGVIIDKVTVTKIQDPPTVVTIGPSYFGPAPNR